MKESYGEVENKSRFSFYYDDNQGKSVTMDVSTSDGAYKIVKEFERFMKACGYITDLHLTIRGPAQEKLLAPRENVVAQAAKEERVAKSNFDFSNIPNNNWLFGTQPIPALTTADLSGITVTDLTTGETRPLMDAYKVKVNEYPTMAPLTTEQIQSWSTEMPGTLGSAKVKF
jgi:hypothetical protein